MSELPPWAAAALEAAARGDAVFPLLAKDNIPVRWGSQATTAREQIEKWARKFPRATGYGIALRVDQYVFDADSPEAVAWCRENLPATRVVRTGRRSGGEHFYLRPSEGHRLRMLNTGLGTLLGVPGLDGKTMGGYVVGPGSAHKSGALYTLVVDEPVAKMPVWLQRKIGDRPEMTESTEAGLTPDEQAEFAANAAWGVTMRREAMSECMQIGRNLVQYLRATDERWSDAFLDAGIRMGAYLPSGALGWDEAVALLERIYEDEDAWGVPGSNIPRSIRRGLAYGARDEKRGWL